MSWVAAGVAVAGIGTSIYKGVKANSDRKKQEAELERLAPSFYKIQDEYNQNRNLAGSLAQEGLPESTKNYFTTEAQRGFGTAIGATQANGGTGGNDAGRLYQTYLDSIDKTAAQDAQMKVSNIHSFMEANKELAGQKTMQWTLNELRPYERRVKQLTGNIADEKLNANNSFNDALGYASSFATGLSNSQLMDNLFRNRNNQSGNVPQLQYNEPTNFVAQQNPTSFQAPQQSIWSAATDINGNPLYTPPTRPI